MAAPTLQEFVAGEWKTATYERCKPSTRKRMDSALRTQLIPTFGCRRLDRIDRGAVHSWFDRYSMVAPGGANRTLDVLRQILNSAVTYGYLPTNPTQGVARNRRPKPTRFLSRTEVDRLHAALDAHRGRESGRQQAEIIRLLLLTGCRKGELMHLRWTEIDGDTLRLADTKTGPEQSFSARKLARSSSASHGHRVRMSSPRRLIHRTHGLPSCRSGARCVAKRVSKMHGCTISAIRSPAMP